MTPPAETRPASWPGTLGLTALAMLAFAGNSLLCRLALKQSAIDPTSFTTIRLAAGALVLGLASRGASGAAVRADWPSVLALLAYAIAFSWAYVGLSAAAGALLLFGAVQVTMIGVGLRRGERLSPLQTSGFAAACLGLLVLLLPGAHAPDVRDALLMAGAGVAWGVYSLRGRGAGSPLRVNAGNFWRAALIALLASVLTIRSASIDLRGALCALASGGIASGLGYSIWYAAVRRLSATSAAAVQLSVPVLASLGGVWWLDEPLSWSLVVLSLVVLGGVGLVIARR
jgi:drug/metabolite transporter (DMT)-like permease